MEKKPLRFILSFKGRELTVEEHTVAGTPVYRVQYPDNHPPLVITRASNADTEKWWTSIPEGRLPEAQAIGPLIEAHIKSLQ